MISPQFTTSQHYDLQDQQDDLLERLAGQYTSFEAHDMLVKAFEKTNTGELSASFKDGIRLAEVVEDAIKPKIGIAFLAGADTPQVTQMEQIQMSQKEPDQKDASWRVNTAGALLKNFDVDKSMSIIATDNTPAVIAAARLRMNATGPFTDPHATIELWLYAGTKIESSRYTVTMSRSSMFCSPRNGTLKASWSK